MMDNVKILQLSYGNYVSADDYFKLQSNWNSLREWINIRLQAEIIRTGMRNEELLIVLDKMNELEGEDK